MSYEAGSKECRKIIEAKENILKAMEALDNLESAQKTHIKLKTIYDELEELHELRKALEN